MVLNKVNNLIKLTPTRKVISALHKPGILLPVLIVEGSVVAGRTYQAYKRDGFIEARERITEEVITSAFWLWGIDMFNKLGNFIGKKAFKLGDKAGVAYGQDALRHPIKNVSGGVPALEKKLAAFKLGKIVASVILAASFAGMLVPKLNQAITKRFLSKEKYKNKNNTQNQSLSHNSSNQIWWRGHSRFVSETLAKNKPSFKSATSIIETVGYNLEQNAICKLMSMDAGVIGGRAKNARNRHERTEILVRDLGSTYFYLFAIPNIKSAFTKLDKYSSITRLDPTSATMLHNKIIHTFKKNNISSLSPADFTKLMLGSGEQKISQALMAKAKDGRILLADFIAEYPNLAGKAKLMSGLQPKMLNEGILSVKQAQDVLSDGVVKLPSFLRRVFTKYFGKGLLDPMSYTPQKKIETLQTHLEQFVKGVSKYASDNNLQVDADLLKKLNKRNLTRNVISSAVGFGVAILFLSTLIPKLQYWITEKRTGKNAFPGTETYSKFK